MKHHITTIEKLVTEWNYTSGIQHTDPFNTMKLDIIITHADGDSWQIPAFWAGEQEWRVRFSPPKPGTYTLKSNCSDPSDSDLHGIESMLEVSPYKGDNPLYIHGPLCVAKSKRTFLHADGTPFFWLGDTWWMALCKRLSWPDDFQLLTADRVAKGFTVIQIVAGLYPDMPGFDERGANESGFPWEHDYSGINPAYFDAADLRIRWLVQNGLVPCIVGCWGYYLPILGIEKMKQHWRYLIARWGAYPVVWCLAGEAAMPYYLSKAKGHDKQIQNKGWTEIGRYVREIDPYSRLITIHPDQIGRDQIEEDTILDFDMLQTGHGGYESVANTVDSICHERERTPTMPVLIGEVNYEGIIHNTQAEVQRLTFWSSVLSGAAGYTYGANGIWQINTKEQPYGPSPHGGNWGNTPWEDACQLPGSYQLGLARQLLERYHWWEFEPHQEWIQPAGSPENVNATFVAGIPGQVRIIYFYNPTLPWEQEYIKVINIEPGIQYSAFFWDPRTGEEHTIGKVDPDTTGCWQVPLQPIFSDWILVLEARGKIMKQFINRIPFDLNALLWTGFIILTIFLIILTRSKSIEEKYSGKKVLRVAFYMRVPEVGRVWDEVKANFEKEHPDVLIIWVEDIQKKLSILEAANMLPDIMTPSTFFLYRYRNSLTPLDELIERDWHDMQFDDFYHRLLKLCNYNNKQLTIPYVFNVSLLYYNIDKFNKAGVQMPTANWTYDDYITAAKQFDRFDEHGRQIQWGTSIIPSWWIEWLSHVHKAGGRFISDDWRRSPMDEPEAIRGLTFFNDIVNTHKVSPKARDLDNIPFLNQQTAMDFAGHLDNWIGLRSTANFKWDVTLLPKSPEGENGGEWVAVGLGINKKCKHKELAWEFIKYITNYENRVKFVNAGMSPVRKSVARDVFFKRGPDGRYLVDPQHKGVIYQALEQCREQSQLPEFFQMAQTQALPHIHSMLRQEITPEECGQIIGKTVTNFLQMIDRKNPLYDYEKGCLKVSDE